MKCTLATTEEQILHQYWLTVRKQGETITSLGVLSELFLSPSTNEKKNKNLQVVCESVTAVIDSLLELLTCNRQDKR